MSELFNVNQRLSNFIQKQLNAKGETTDENRPIGSKATLNGKDVFWSGQNYGWQSQESFNKLKEGPEFRAGHIALSRLGTDINQAIGMGINALPKPVKATGIEAIRQGVQAYQSLPQGVRTGIGNVVQAAGDINEEVSKRTNISPIITGEALTAAATAGVGSAVKRAATGMNVVDTLTDATKLGTKTGVDYNLTLKLGENIPQGIKKGSAWSPEWAAQTRDFYQRRANIRERLQAAADRKSKRVGSYKEEMYNTVSTGPSRNPDLNPEAYGDAKKFDKFKEQSEVTPLTPKGNVKWQQQHHMFSKQESYQFVERMIELGDDDDVLAMFIMAEDMDAALGGRLSNMLNMEDLPHSVLHGSRITDKRQLQSAAMRNLVENAKSTDELMNIFRQYITDNVQPSKEEAKALKIIGQRLMKIEKFGEMEQLRDKMYR